MLLNANDEIEVAVLALLLLFLCYFCHVLRSPLLPCCSSCADDAIVALLLLPDALQAHQSLLAPAGQKVFLSLDLYFGIIWD